MCCAQRACCCESLLSALQPDKGEIVEQMGQLLEGADMRDVLPLPKARVPVVKFVVPDTNTKVWPQRC